MAPVTIGLHLEDDRPLAGANPGERLFGGTATGEHVHAVDLDAGNAEALATLVELVLGRRAVDARAHRVLVVLDDVDDRQLPQLGHVEAFIDLALIGRAVTEIGEANPAIALVFVAEAKPGAKRHLRADNTVPAVEFMLDAEHVHRAALALRDSSLAPRQLGHD